MVIIIGKELSPLIPTCTDRLIILKPLQEITHYY